MSWELPIGHPLKIQAQRQRAAMEQWRASAGGQATLQRARERSTPIGQTAGPPVPAELHAALTGSPAAATGHLARPDGPMGPSINQRPPGTSWLMSPNRTGGRDAVGHARALTGGGSPGSMVAQQSGEQRRNDLLGGLPNLQPMAATDKSRPFDLADAFRRVDDQTNRVAERERQGLGSGSPMASGAAGPPGAPPMVNALTAQFAMPPDAHTALADVIMNPIAPARKPAPAYRPLTLEQVASGRGTVGTNHGGELALPLVGNQHQRRRAMDALGVEPAGGAAAAGPPRIALGGATEDQYGRHK